jgi:tetratricopeptide (TPR) repeat protein
MHRSCTAWIASAVILAANHPLCAGLYDPRQPTSPLVTESGVRPLPFELFRDTLSDITQIADPLKPSTLRPKYLERRTALLSRGVGTMSPNDLAELGMIQWRLRDADAALTALRLAEARDPRNFWVMSNLGAVYLATGQLRETAPYLDTARSFFPDPWPVVPAAGAWFREAERYQAALLRLRIAEGADRPGRRVASNDVDALFPVRFVGPTGMFEAGKLADDQRTKLPADAIPVVQQLMLWFPDDTRLLWLLGELYNAQGDLTSADAAFELCVWSRHYESPALREHRRLVKAAIAATTKVESAAETSEQPKPVLLPESWQLWTVVVVSGAVLLALGFFQVRELLRRKRSPIPPAG